MAIMAQDTKLRPGYKQTEAGVIPEDWDMMALGEIASIGSGGTPDRLNPAYWGGDVPWVTTTQINFNLIDKANEFITRQGLENSAARVYDPGTLLMAMYGQGKTRGKVAILAMSAAINQACAAIKVNKSISNEYVFFNLSARYEEIRSLSNTGNQENLNSTIIKNILLPLPKGEKEQHAIVTALSDVDALITSLDKLIAKKRDIKQATMQQLLTGKTRLPGFSSEWEMWKFEEIFQFLNTANNSRSDLSNHGEIKYIHYGDIHTKWRLFLDCSNDELPSIQKAKVTNIPFLEDGDLVMADASEDYDGLGISIEVKNATGKKVVAGLHTFLLRGNKEIVADGFKGYLQYIPFVNEVDLSRRSTVGRPERPTQNRVVGLFRQQLGYEYLGNWEYRENNSNIDERYLRPFLKRQGYSDTLINKAVQELREVAGDSARSLYDVNRAVYGLLRYGVQVRPDVGENTETVWLIDWKEPLKNDFAIAEEVTVKGENTKRPDIVLYVNGIALGVLELKRSIVSVSEGIRQNLDNQSSRFIRPFFATMQLVMAGNDTEGLRYGVIETREKYYLTWKEESAVENPLDRSLMQLCEKRRLLEILENFIVFDAGVKKICRPNQYFGVIEAQKRVKRREGGIIWHTQGSGKSLTMVWLARWIREHVPDARVLIITDRTELDEQIEKVFQGVNESIYRTKSGHDLIHTLNATTPWLFCSLIHEFSGKDEGDIKAFIEEIKSSVSSGFRAKGDLYVFVDECHRTQSGDLHEAMKAILPNAMFIGFTGTPLLKADKEKSIEVFGSYIHTYRFDEAVGDKVVLDLRYEARDIEQSITSQQKIDQWFEAKTRGLTDVALAQLKQKWGTLRKVLSSQSRLEMIVNDIIFDMGTQPRLLGRGNAMLVSSSIYQACKFYELFLAQGFDKCAIVTSYRPSPDDIKGEATGEGLTEKLKQYDIYMKMLGGKDPETFEREVKQKFIETPGQMKLLIVVDKLLTGFDAPSATYLYIDKQMRDHGLFQAICRVNRLDGEDKDYGYIIDYKDLFKSLERSIHDYTSEALDGYAKDDIDGLLSDRLEKAREQLDDAREAIKSLCEPVTPKDTLGYIHYFCARDTTDKNALKENEPKRVALYKLTASLVRAYANIANELEEAGYSSQESEKIRQEVKYYENVRREIKLASGDAIDLKAYEPDMRHLIDTYIRASESSKVSAFDDMSLIQLIVERGEQGLDYLPPGLSRNKAAMAETIENNLRRLIIDEMPVNPNYYEKMSELLDTLIAERQQQALEYAQYLEKIVELTRRVKTPSSIAYLTLLKTRGQRVLYDNLGKDEQRAIEVDEVIKRTRKDGWRNSIIKERELRLAIGRVLPDEAQVNTILEIVKNQDEY